MWKHFAQEFCFLQIFTNTEYGGHLCKPGLGKDFLDLQYRKYNSQNK